LAYLEGRETSDLSPASAERDVRAGVLAQCEEVEKGLEDEIASSDRHLDDLRNKRDRALGQLLERSPEVIHLMRRIGACWRKLAHLAPPVRRDFP